MFRAGILQEKLQLSSRTVMRVRAAQASRPFFCTAFFILPDTVVVPHFAVSGEGTDSLIVEAAPETGLPPFALEPVREGEELGNTRILGEQFPDGPLLTLIRVREGTNLVMPLQFESVEVDDLVLLPQYSNEDQPLLVSFGSLRAVAEPTLSYDADTLPGSSGAPVLDSSFQMIGVHFASDTRVNLNVGITRAAFVDLLRSSSLWERIKDYHRIADVAAASAAVLSDAPPREPERSDELLLRAALRASIDPTTLSEEDAEELRPHIADSSAPSWVLSSGTRTSVLAAAGSLDALRPYAPKPAETQNEPLQRVILRVLEGPPYDLTRISEEELPWWIQASRWFAGVSPELPTPAEVTRVLEQRRVRSRLARIASKDFTGREKELQLLQHWWTDEERPLSLTGIGGIGKSALVARFASTLPDATLLLWLDFDRADLAPDDAPSILAAVAQQAVVQFDGFSSDDLDFEKWQESAKTLGRRMEEKSNGPALLVLDSFEAAQYSTRYEDLWPVLEAIASEMPSLHLIVTGRAAVPTLQLRGEHALAIDLKGLDAKDARQWLHDRGIADDAVLEQLLPMLGGVPLNLRLALRVFERDRRIPDVPKNTPPEMVSGFLYDRILDRVQPALKPLAKAVLVVRRITADMLVPVFGEAVDGLTAETSSRWFADLTREMALIEGTDVLRLRAEVRRPSLKLLQGIERPFVETLDAKAEQWYAAPERNAASDPEIAAELVYHRLRLGNLSGATEAWRDGSRPFLLDAGDELPPPSLEWLQARLGVIEGASVEAHAAAAANVAERVRSARGRRKKGLVAQILSTEKSRGAERPYASGLVFHEAYEQWKDGNAAAAMDALEEGGDAPAMIGRDRNMLRALLLAKRGDVAEADELLARYEEVQSWTDGPAPTTNALAVRAARIQLTVDLDTELDVLASEDHFDLTPFDVVLPRLQNVVSSMSFGLESTPTMKVLNVDEPEQIRSYVDHCWKKRRISDDGPNERLRKQAMRRWRFAGTTSFLAEAAALAVKPEQTPLEASIVGILALFAPRFELEDESVVLFAGTRGTLLHLLTMTMGDRALRVEASRSEQVERVLAEGLNSNYSSLLHTRGTQSGSIAIGGGVRMFPEEDRPLLIYLMTPNPLDQIVHELAGYTSEAR
ncbi:MAG TPA: serine protease [Thermoanaerobaculia bacterium]|nr:serine protease [Thermoanaerobaculia bacterium]